MADFTKAVEIVMQREGPSVISRPIAAAKPCTAFCRSSIPISTLLDSPRRDAHDIYRRDYGQEEFNKIPMQKLFDGAVNLVGRLTPDSDGQAIFTAYENEFGPSARRRPDRPHSFEDRRSICRVH